MALIDKASLLMVPSTYEDGTLYNVLPSGNKAPDETGNHNGYDQTRADFTFSRGSNLAATRVNASGLIEKGRENVLTYSNDFSQWSKVNSSVTSGQSGYNNLNDAWLLTATSTGPRIQFTVSKTGVNTFSIYAKAGSVNWLRLLVIGTSNYARYFDLENGVKGGSVYSTEVDSEITNIGNGWYRCSITTNVSISEVRVYLADADGTQSTTSSGSIYIQDAQLEAGLVATDYIETGATTATAGVLENTPRIDYSSGAGALLLEPQRTNLFAQSEYFGAWNISGAITTNTATSPEGLQNASTFTTSAAGEDLRDNTNVTGTYTFSLFVKLIDVGGVRLRIDAATDANAYFDLSDGSVFSSDGIIDADAIDYGNNWWRVYMTANVTNTQKIQIFTTDGTTSYANGGVYLYGAQLEAASHVSSYVPTYGSAATRGAESGTSASTNDLFTSGEGVVFMEFDIDDVTISGYPQVFRIENPSDTTDKFWGYIFNNANSGQIEFGYRLDENGVKKSEGSFTIDTTTTAKIAMRLENNNYAAYYNGTKDVPTQYAGVVGNLTKMVFSSVPYPVGVSLKQLVIINEALSDSELATLTTL